MTASLARINLPGSGMTKRIGLGASILLLTMAGFARAAPQEREATNAARINELFQMDGAVFERELERRFQYGPPQPMPAVVEDVAVGQALDAAYFEAFPDFDRSYSPHSRARAKALAARLTAEAPQLSHEEFVLRVAEIAALADNAHTSINEDALRKNTLRIPLRMFLFGEGLHVLRAVPAYAELLGARIERIEGKTIDELYAALSKYLPGPERRRRLQLIPLLESPALLHAAGLAGEPSSLTLSARLADGRLIERRIDAEERGPAAPVMNTMRLLFPAPESGALAGLQFPSTVPVYLRQRMKLFSTDTLPCGGFYIGLTHNNDSDEEPLTAFLESAVAAVRSDRPNYLVFDMRMNGGGDYTKSYDFARALPSVVAGAPIYVITSPWTFSAAITTVAALKEAGGRQVILVGQSVGDRLRFWAEGATFELPNTSIRVHYTAGFHDYRQPCTDRDKCFWLNELYPVQVDNLTPDLPAPLTFAAWRAGRDPAMNAILAREGSCGERG